MSYDTEYGDYEHLQRQFESAGLSEPDTDLNLDSEPDSDIEALEEALDHCPLTLPGDEFDFRVDNDRHASNAARGRARWAQIRKSS